MAEIFTGVKVKHKTGKSIIHVNFSILNFTSVNNINKKYHL